MLADNYEYAINEDVALNQQRIILTQKNSGLTKTFLSCNKSMSGLLRHMENLSDDCCDSFFPKERVPKVKKQVVST